MSLKESNLWNYWKDEKNCKSCKHNIPYYDHSYSRMVDYCVHPDKDEMGDLNYDVKKTCHNPDKIGADSWLWYEPGGPTAFNSDFHTQVALLAKLVYSQLKAKVFNVLESQIENDTRLSAAKRVTEDIITNVTKDMENYIKDNADSWYNEK